MSAACAADISAKHASAPANDCFNVIVIDPFPPHWMLPVTLTYPACGCRRVINSQERQHKSKRNALFCTGAVVARQQIHQRRCWGITAMIGVRTCIRNPRLQRGPPRRGPQYLWPHKKEAAFRRPKLVV